MRLLLVEDEEKVVRFVQRGLAAERFAVDVARDGVAGLELAQNYSYDLIVLDLLLPGLDGTEVLRKIRRTDHQIPILVLTARDAVQDKVTHFEAGADDYLTKPFAFSELLARVQALIRRATHTVEPTTLSAGDIKMDLMSREVTRAGQKIELQSREFALLELLLRYPEKVVTKTMILEHIWDYSFDPQTNVVDVLVHRLRSKVDKDFPVKLIQTIRGVGYVLKPV